VAVKTPERLRIELLGDIQASLSTEVPIGSLPKTCSWPGAVGIVALGRVQPGQATDPAQARPLLRPFGVVSGQVCLPDGQNLERV